MRIERSLHKVPTVFQMEATECGAASLGMILAYYRYFEPLEKLREACGVSRNGSKASLIAKAARERYKLECHGYRVSAEKVCGLPLPCIIFWNANHYVVLEGRRGDFFYINDPAGGKRLIRSQETNLGDLVADGIYAYFNEIEELGCDIAIMNGGGIRADVAAGDWSYMTCKTVSPFGNVACLMSVTGAQIQNALEFGARYAGSGQENGGFLQVAGATYEIHTDIPNTVPTDSNNVWAGPATGTPRVQNVKIYNRATGVYEPLDPARTYTMGGMNYTLRSLGDGFAMFDGATLVKDYVSEDYLVLSSYAMLFDGGVITTANSPLADYPGYLMNYENPYGSGRIVLI